MSAQLELRGNNLLRPLYAAAPFVGVIGFAVATIVTLASSGTDSWERQALENGLLWLVGVQGLFFGLGHLISPDRVAESIGWPKGNPFQREVGLASVSYGVLGALASGHGREWWLAAIVAFSIFYLGAAVGHVREMVVERNFSAGNAGPVFVFDVAAPLLLIALYIAYPAASDAPHARPAARAS
jgi:hypothetical protein